MNRKSLILVLSLVVTVVIIGILIGVFGSDLVTRLMEMHRGG
jgi:hypothetical protein